MPSIDGFRRRARRGSTSGRPLLVHSRRLSTALAWWTALSILGGIAVLMWATVALPVASAIAIDPSATSPLSIRAGVLFWIVLGLGGSLRPASLEGHAVLTMHLPFIVAAMLLGGPVAGGWVAFIATIELRELREVPWYGTLTNHAVHASAAVLGGLAAVGVRDVAATVVAPQAAVLGAAVAGALIVAGLTIGHAAVTVALRERLEVGEALALFGSAWQRTMVAEIVLAWMLAFAYAALGWWAALASAVLAVFVWEAHEGRERASHDEMTGLLNRHGVAVQLRRAVSRARGGSVSLLIALDLDGFKAINDTYGHEAGDEALRVVGKRLREEIRIGDAAARIGGDEFALVLCVPGEAAALAFAERIRAAVGKDVTVSGHEVALSASLGLVLIDECAPRSPRDLLVHADLAMYEAKRAGGGIRLAACAALSQTQVPRADFGGASRG